MAVTTPDAMRAGAVADAVRGRRLVAVMRRVERTRLVDLVLDLANEGVRVFEVTFDDPAAERALASCRDALAGGGYDDAFVGAGTLREPRQVETAVAVGAAFGVSPVLDPDVVAAALSAGLPFVPGVATPTEADRAWRLGATFVKLFPGSSLGPGFVRELRGPLPEIELVVTGGIDGTNARAFLDAGAVAVGIGSGLVNASRDERRAVVSAVRGPT